MFEQVAFLFVADEVLAVSNVLHSFTRGEIDFVNVHDVGIGASGSLSWQDVAISPSLEFPELYHVPVKLSCLVKPLFPFPSSLFLAIREGGGGYHDDELLGYSSLEGIHKENRDVVPGWVPFYQW